MPETDTTAGHYCGQTQPHAAHVWHTPRSYGSLTFTNTYQCAGFNADLDCPHLSASGIDQNWGPDKVWRCDSCGTTWRENPLPAAAAAEGDTP